MRDDYLTDPSIENLDLSDQQLTALPDNIGQLSRLTRLSLGSNRLTTLPDSFWQLATLRLLSMGQSRLLNSSAWKSSILSRPENECMGSCGTGCICASQTMPSGEYQGREAMAQEWLTEDDTSGLAALVEEVLSKLIG